ncbi:SH3 domain-containing protein 19-like isoform X2 [Portunus trituberculatus]|uniref:SH3 domain-containing protein 19-like isoform X2 n=1 Tax=Portunus trituberculatus TaxID=210409 RepID=UPI001E1CE4DA|nr:SH3 domain-containing protein 19-like isoform X2 [Portunus trituberculatus]
MCMLPDIRPVRRAPPPPSSRKAGPHPRIYLWNDDLLIIDQGEEENIYSTGRSKAPPQRSSQNGLPRSASLPLNNGSQKRAPPPRPPPPKKNPSHKSNQQPDYSSSSKSGVGSIIGKLRGPAASSRSRQSLTHSSTSAPCTPVTEASLIDLSSPPGSPTTRSGSDGLSVNSFGSESSTGNQSSGFDDSFDPFGSIQENNIYAVPKKIGVSSFYSNMSAPTFSASQNIFALEENQDPFDTLANRASKYNIKNQQLHNSSAPLSTSQLTRPLNQIKLDTQITSSKPENKSNFKPTIIRPKAPVSSVQVERAGDNVISSQMGELETINWSTALKGNTAKQPGTRDNSSSHIMDQTIPEEPPPLPPRPETEQEDHDRPHGIADFDFIGTQPDDLSLKTGDVVQLLYRISDEWLFGRCGPKEGMFPQNFIKIVVPLAGEQTQSSHSASTGTSGSTKSKQSAAPKASPVIHTATVMYTFLAEAPEDLTVHEGNLVQVTGHLNDQWLYGQCNGKWGQFPANFVDCIPPNLPQPYTRCH